MGRPRYFQGGILIEQRKSYLFAYLNEIEKMRAYPIEYKTIGAIVTLAVLPVVVNFVGYLIRENIL